MNYAEISPAQIVKRDIRAAAVFERYGVDFCCKGKEPLQRACQELNVDFHALTAELSSIIATTPPAGAQERAFDDMFASDLITYILERHHSYVRRATPGIQRHLSRVVERHGADHPETAEALAIFNVLADDLEAHLFKEEQILFPLIGRLEKAKRTSAPVERHFFGTVESPIRVMESEHEEAGDMMRRIRELTNHYTPPPSACNTFKAAYAELKEFEEDLHRHVHLENNILHDKARNLEIWFYQAI